MTAQLAYGVRLEGEIPVDGLPAACGGELATVKVVMEQPSTGSQQKILAPPDAEFLVRGRPLSLRVNGGLEIRWHGVATFRWTVGEALIKCAREPEGSLAQVQHLFLQYALPLHLLVERRLQFLHGGAVQIGAHAVGFLAPSGAGKSTLAEYFLRRGHGFLADDKLAVVRRQQQFMAVPSTPLYSIDEAKERSNRAANFVTCPLPLAVLYLLAPVDRAANPVISPVRAAEAPLALARRCELELPPRVRQRLQLPPLVAQRFHDCSALASAVRVSRLFVPRDRSRLPEVYDLIITDLGGSV